MLYVIYDEIDQKNWIFFEAEGDRAARRIMRQSILHYQKDIDFSYSLLGPIELPCRKDLNSICNSDDLFKSEIEDSQEDNE